MIKLKIIIKMKLDMYKKIEKKLFNNIYYI